MLTAVHYSLWLISGVKASPRTSLDACDPSIPSHPEASLSFVARQSPSILLLVAVAQYMTFLCQFQLSNVQEYIPYVAQSCAAFDSHVRLLEPKQRGRVARVLFATREDGTLDILCAHILTLPCIFSVLPINFKSPPSPSSWQNQMFKIFPRSHLNSQRLLLLSCTILLTMPRKVWLYDSKLLRTGPATEARTRRTHIHLRIRNQAREQCPCSMFRTREIRTLLGALRLSVSCSRCGSQEIKEESQLSG